MTTDQPAECFPLGDHLRNELDVRGWTIHHLGCRTTVPNWRLTELLNYPDTIMTMSEAESLGYALGVSSVLLLNLQLSYRKWKKG